MLRKYGREIRFVSLFLLILGVLNYLYYRMAGSPAETFILSTLTATPPAAIINLLTPEEKVVVDGTLLASKHVTFSVVSGCEGMGGILLIISAIAALPIPWKDRLRGVCYGAVFLYTLNILRIVILYYVMRHFSRAFDFAHFFVGQTIIIVLGCVFFVVWISMNLERLDKGAAG